MTTCSESGQVRKEAAIRSLCRASESIERTGAFWCRDTARPAARVGLMMGIASLITAMAPAVGPSLGGLIVSNWGWRMIFVALLPLLLLSLLFGAFSIRQVTETQKATFQTGEYLLLVLGFACGIARLPNTSPPTGPRRPKIIRKGAFI